MNAKMMKLTTVNKKSPVTVRNIAPICTLFALVLWGNGQAFGDCYFSPTTDTTLPMHLTLPSSLVIQRDTPVGTVLWTSGQSTPTGETRVKCSLSPYTEATQYITAQSVVAGYSDVYQTTVPGIGFRVRNQGTYSLWASVPTTANYTPPGANIWVYNESKYIFFKMELIYIGGTANGQLSFASPLASLTTGVVTAGQLYVDGSTAVTKVACSLTNTSISVPLGDVSATQFTGITTTAGDKTFNLGLSCDKDANINVALAGSQNADTADTSVLALTNAGQSGTAKGVGVQLLYGSVPLKLNNNILLKTSVGGQETLPFSARYYQTQTTIGAGLANSSATLNITYQ